MKRSKYIYAYISLYTLYIHIYSIYNNRILFYASQIGLAIQHLHDYGIIYRDLKPENILIDSDGYIKLTDFGTSKKLKENEKTMSIQGIPEYLSPEIISGEGHNKACDWWSFGVLIYEMAFGEVPFYNSNTDKMYELIKSSNVSLPNNVKVSSNFKDLIVKLLDKNKETRLGSKKGFYDIKNHAFFQQMDFDSLLSKKLPAPYIPLLRNKYDVQNFDEEFTSENPDDVSVINRDSLDLVKSHQEKFFDAFK